MRVTGSIAFLVVALASVIDGGALVVVGAGNRGLARAASSGGGAVARVAASAMDGAAAKAAVARYRRAASRVAALGDRALLAGGVILLSVPLCLLAGLALLRGRRPLRMGLTGAALGLVGEGLVLLLIAPSGVHRLVPLLKVALILAAAAALVAPVGSRDGAGRRRGRALGRGR